MSPFAPPSACLEPRCSGYAVSRGRCEVHQQTTTQRGYGTGWQQRTGPLRKGARCERCGVTGTRQAPLHVDHVLPRSLGGTDDPTNLRVLCSACHGSVGVRLDRGGGVPT